MGPRESLFLGADRRENRQPQPLVLDRQQRIGFSIWSIWSGLGDVQVALFRAHEGTIHAIDNIDPFSGAAVLSRGIVGDRAGVATVASPV